jgi:hypothetical protein
MKVTIQIVDDSGNVFAGEAVLDRISNNGQTTVRVESKSNNQPSTKVTCPSAIERLWKKEKFKQALSFPDVKAALGQEGYSFPRNTVMMALQSAAFLTRHGGRGNYTWMQKYPSNH